MCSFFAAIFSGCERNGERVSRVAAVSSENGQNIVVAKPSEACKQCHEDIYASWQQSDHANANRLFDLDDWKRAFMPTQYFTQGGDVSRFYVDPKSGKAVIETIGSDGSLKGFTPEMVLAYRPLVQFLIPEAGGRWQTTELAWDVNQHDWFNVYGEEHRQPEEWGHWSRRGMNWNAQCAVCHTSFYSKNYDPASDSYASAWKEMGINCQQCHGEMPEHMANPEADVLPTEKVTDGAYFESCVSCHSRREDLTGHFRIGDRFTDHHRLQLPVSDRYYFSDGQIKDEVFVYGSFLMSKMHQQGVRCMDCHDPHSMGLKLPFENNALCMRCHQSPGLDGATVIDPVTHSHHQEGSMGNRCVECHMPERTYMERDPRRDHGFHTPDPFLSEELGLPNACMNCHDQEGEGTEWVKTAYLEWYGDSENLQSKRAHARVVARGYQRDPSVKPAMIELLSKENSPMWKGAFIQMLLEMQPTQEEFNAMVPYLQDEHAIVRSATVQALSNFPEMDALLKPKLEDESRLVRLDASWYLRDQLPESDILLEEELMHYMDYTSDQPGGALRKAHFHAEKGDKTEALKWMQKVVLWDQTSADAWVNRGLMLNRFDEREQAIESFEKAHELAPNSVIPLSYAAMLISETGSLSDIQAAWERILKVDETYGRAWYNLGLLMAQNGNPSAAISYLDQGIAVTPDDPDIRYAKATILYQNGDVEKAKNTLVRLLEISPNYTPALRMQQLLDTGR